MSGSESTPPARGGQEKNEDEELVPGSMEEDFRRFDARMRFGTVTRQDIIWAYRISPDTLKVWEEKGLTSIRMSTRMDLFRVKDVQQFFNDMETFRGKPKRKQTKGKKAPPPQA